MLMDRVLIVANWDWVIYNFRLPLARALVKAGYEVILVCPQGIYVDRIRARGYRVELWPLSLRSTNPVAELLAVGRLRSLYARLAPTVAHHFTLKPNFYGSLAAFTLGSNKPLVINTFTGLGFFFSHHRLATLLRGCLMPLLRPSLVQNSNWTIFQNDADRDSFLKARLALPQTSRVIAGSGVDVTHFRYKSRRPQSGTAPVPVVFTGARLLWDKGIPEIVQAAEILRNRNISVEFWIAGAADGGNLAAIPQATITQWERQGLVRFLGHREDMRELLEMADVALLASEHEGLPRFLLEAAASGLPLIGTDIPGCRMIVREGVNGSLVPVKSPESIANAVAALLSDPERMRRYAAASRQIAETEYSEATIMAEYLNLYAAVRSSREVRQGASAHS
jgi:glycosyltransferase involved in cell wall biosynthesis